ncbi:VIT domain-containing protein [Pyxidicoccus xibeiensis]|uniref:VIT domain-containing protein n=1 Tax=Pyxidicoccus xibeiensis TaxID=2906759 RepID=UPI0020A75CF3|nr:VIT domain-containing protein [Pyxidicoccus xibeiensis]MCP3136804.1 VWA domain-containing protein [Pyxidicoccus xibeiensis]
MDGRQLPLTAVALRAEAQGGIARVTLTQQFQNPYAEPLQVSYQVPMPADGAVAGYAFRIGERRIVGEVDKVQAARERFDQALVSGRTAALLTQERTSLFTQELGNVPPGQPLTVELTVDQRLRWLSEGMWEWRFPTVVAPRYLGAEGHTPDADRICVDVASGPTGLGVTFELSIGDVLLDGREPECPSHPVRCSHETGKAVARLEQGALLDRDIVVRWPVATPEAGVRLHGARLEGRLAESAFGLLTLVPPAVKPAGMARDLVILLDVSGSMGGPPLEYCKRVICSLIDTLEERDSLELLVFSSQVRRWTGGPVPANEVMRGEAMSWVRKLAVGGATHMHQGIQEALRPLRPDSQRQVLLFTDGFIGFEQDIVSHLLWHLPRGSRLHTVGVGSSVNRSLTQAAARAGRGVEVLIGLDEDVERGTARLIAATRAPVVVEVTVEGDAVEDVAPASVTDLLAGAPVLLSLKLRPEGGPLTVRGRTPEGSWERRLLVPPLRPGEGSPAIAALYAREKVEDLSMRIAGGAPREEMEPSIERLGLEHRIATALTAWIAVSEEPTVDATAPTRREVMPQELPHGMSASGLGLQLSGGMVSRPLIQVRRIAPAASGAEPPSPPEFLGRAPIRAFMVVTEEPERTERPRRKPKRSGHRRDEVDVAPEQGPIVLRGRRLGASDGLDTLELQCEALFWDPGVTFEAELADGTRITLDVDLTTSTRKMLVTHGQQVRLRFKSVPSEVVMLRWTCNDVEYVVAL